LWTYRYYTYIHTVHRVRNHNPYHCTQYCTVQYTVLYSSVVVVDYIQYVNVL
jgi:hypothetical protein